ncbi:MAG: alpha/beta fold hydrolase [Actinomycetia bacterium]|nr:alpha/beta fold hydrolase [Actinomycetes bacterium]
MRILRTPDDAVSHLADYPTERRYVTIPASQEGDEEHGLRVNLIDAGDPDGPPIVFLHGNPSWSYIWRHQIEAVTEAGYRAFAPDLVGMGMSDKPSEMADYTVARHVAWMRSLLFEQLDLNNITFVLHDWGAIIGMRLAAEQPDRVASMVISNSGLPWRDMAEPLPEVIEATGPFADFQAMAAVAPTWEPWTLLPMVMVSDPSPELTGAYRAPYPDLSLTVGSRALTQLLPTRPDNPMYPDNDEAWKVLEEFTKPVLTIFSAQDVVAPDGWQPIVARIPGAAGQPHVILDGGGHFLQEDIPELYTQTLMSWLGQQRQ